MKCLSCNNNFNEVFISKGKCFLCLNGNDYKKHTTQGLTRLEINNKNYYKPKLIIQAKALRIKGFSFRKICDKLNKKNDTTISRTTVFNWVHDYNINKFGGI